VVLGIRWILISNDSGEFHTHFVHGQECFVIFLVIDYRADYLPTNGKHLLCLIAGNVSVSSQFEVFFGAYIV
jgi:hypothetical protein